MAPVAITHRPSPEIGRCELTYVARQPIDYDTAVAQHAGYRAMLRGEGIDVVTLDANLSHPDSVFVEDAAVVLDEVAIITMPGAVSRRGEIDAIERTLRQYREAHRIALPGTLDGGDVVRIGRSLLVGVSSRTNLAGVRSLGLIAGRYGYAVSPVTVRGALHLKSACCALPDGRLFMNPEWLARTDVAAHDVVPIPSEEPWAADILLLDDVVCLADEHRRAVDLIDSLGFTTRTTPLSEFAKAEGGITCLSLLVDGA
jgi:dimethylargininase